MEYYYLLYLIGGFKEVKDKQIINKIEMKMKKAIDCIQIQIEYSHIIVSLDIHNIL